MSRITVVDDNRDFLELMAEVLAGEGHEPTALDARRPDLVEALIESTPDMLVLDVRMGTDRVRGWELVEEIRRSPGMADVPILLCTADIQALDELEDRAEHAPGIRVLGKPFGIDDLTGRLERLLAESEPE